MPTTSSAPSVRPLRSRARSSTRCGETPSALAASMRATTSSDMRAEAVSGSPEPSRSSTPASSPGMKHSCTTRMGTTTTVPAPSRAVSQASASARLSSTERNTGFHVM